MEQIDQDEREFEQALTRGLRRVDAPGDLMARVMAQVETQQGAEQRTAQVVRSAGSAGGWRTWFSFSWKPAWGAMAALLVASVLTGHVVHEHRIDAQERARVQASREFDVSVQITDKAMEHTREQLRKAGVAVDDDGR